MSWKQDDYFDGCIYIKLNSGDRLAYDLAGEEFSVNNLWNTVDTDKALSLITDSEIKEWEKWVLAL